MLDLLRLKEYWQADRLDISIDEKKRIIITAMRNKPGHQTSNCVALSEVEWRSYRGDPYEYIKLRMEPFLDSTPERPF